MIKCCLLFAILALASCRCRIDYEPVSATLPSSDTIMATALMSQGQFEYLGITITIKRLDSLFVKDIVVNPSLPNGKFYPWFSHYSMYSYFHGDTSYLDYKGQYESGYYWQDYFADTFSELPTVNRHTNKGKSLISYTVHYNSKQSINFDKFSANIEVILVNKDGKTITHKRHVDFHGKKDCRFSIH